MSGDEVKWISWKYSTGTAAFLWTTGSKNLAKYLLPAPFTGLFLLEPGLHPGFFQQLNRGSCGLTSDQKFSGILDQETGASASSDSFMYGFSWNFIVLIVSGYLVVSGLLVMSSWTYGFFGMKFAFSITHYLVMRLLEEEL